MSLKDKVEVFEDYLKKRTLNFGKIAVSDGAVFTMGFGRSKSVYPQLNLIIHIDDDAIQTIVPLPDCAEGKELRVVEFLNRLNYNIRYGKFELDFRDAEVQFRLVETSDVLGVPHFVKKVIERQIYLPIAMVEYLSRGYKRLLEDESCSVLDALAVCENNGE